VAQLVAALITVHGLLSFLSDVYGLFDPSGKTLWLSVDHRRLRSVDDMVLLGCVVGESGFVMFCIISYVIKERRYFFDVTDTQLYNCKREMQFLIKHFVSENILCKLFADTLPILNTILTCREEAARCFVSLNISQSYSRLLEIIRNNTVE